MAVDSIDRRRSAVNHLQRILPAADNDIDRDDRLHVAGFYCCSIVYPINDGRKSTLNHIVRLLPDPDGTIDEADRMLVNGFCNRITPSSGSKISTEDKRKSAVNQIDTILPVPDGGITAYDRMHVDGFYRFGETDPTSRRITPMFYY